MDDNKNILVSVIVPIYNAKNYLKACLDSIVKQTYKNIEIILVDDGSTDGSGDIVDLYAQKDSRIKVIHNTNHGVSYTRNCGILVASGSKVLFIDSDDTVDLDYVKKLVEPLEKQNYNVVICGANDINVKKGKVRARRFPQYLTGNIKNDFLNLFLVPSITAPWGKLYDLDIIKKNNISFAEGISFNEDVLFNVRYFRYVENYALIKEPLYNYYHRLSNSLTKNRSDKNFEGCLKVASELRKFVLDIKVQNGNVALTHTCFNYLKWFAITEGGYSLFKERANKVRNIVDGMYATKGNKRAVNVWMLRNEMYSLLYAIYWLREKCRW